MAVAASAALILGGPAEPVGAAAAAQLAATVLCWALAVWAAGHAAALARRRRWTRWRRAAGGIGLAGLWWLAAHMVLAGLFAPPAEARAGRLWIVTSLPLTSDPNADPVAMALQPASALPPAFAALAAGGGARFVPTLAAGELARGDAILLAHPPALSPAALVAIDAHVRAGAGPVVVLADALSLWPALYPLGDARNPPATSLLTPLLTHWGVVLDAPAAAAPLVRDVQVKDQRAAMTLRLAGAGRFRGYGPQCRPMDWDARHSSGPAHVLRCRVGQGSAVLVGDADLLFAAQFLPRPPWAAHLRPSDNLVWLRRQLAHNPPPISLIRPLWQRPPADREGKIPK